MGPTAQNYRLRWRSLGIVVGAAVAAACDPGTGPNRVARVEVNLPSPTLLIGTNGTAVARAFDLNGDELTGIGVRWRSSANGVVSVDNAGELFGVALGNATITARMGGVDGQAVLTVVPVPVASVQITPGGGPIERGQNLQLRAILRDAVGVELEGRPVTWVSSAPGIASVSGSGNVNAIAAGSAIITASSENRSASVTIDVTVVAVPGGPSIDAITPVLLVPGGTATLTGSGFGETAAQNEVRIAGVLTTVVSASASELVVQIPLSEFGCEPTREVFLQVVRGTVAGARAHPFQAVAQRTLQPGESLILSNAADAKCFELSATGGEYLVSVYNASQTATTLTSAGFRLRGAFGILPPGVAMVRAPGAAASVTRPGALAAATPTDLAGMMRPQVRRAEAEAHARLLGENIEMLRREGPSVLAQRARPSALLASITANQQVGTTVSMKIPDITGSLGGTSGFCTDHYDVTARVKYNGTRAIIVEDVAAPLAGQIDALYNQLGAEFDALMFGLVEANFADPLRLDGVLDQNGKVIMLFSPRINTFASISGFVVSCDFLISPASSNRAEVFYARVPTVIGEDLGTSATPGGWYRMVRSTVVHELKHIAAFSNRIADFGSALDEAWMEEGTARHAEELWARAAAYGGLAQRANATYEQTIFCDVRPAGLPNGPQCIGKPLGMFRHFESSGLHDFLRDNEQRSPLGPRPGTFEASYYGSAWSLLRWALDNHQVEEAAFLGALTRNNQTGVSNLTARLGRPWEEVVGEWSLALYLDDLPDFTPVNTRLQMPSWNLRSIYAGLNADFPASFPLAYPLAPHPATYGDFTFFIPRVSGGSFSMFRLSGTQTGRQLIQLRGTNSEDPNPALRIALVRIN